MTDNEKTQNHHQQKQIDHAEGKVPQHPKFDATAFLNNASQQPGVYRMYSARDELLYVGKAKNLKKRLSSYFQRTVASVKTQALVKLIVRIDTTLTQTEAEALILEHNLIKEHRPRFNILLRDDKSFPYIVLTDHQYPQIKVYRGSRKHPKNAQVFGPFPNASAAKESVNLMQKLFRIRQCDDSYFKHRTRPCLQYQINRCTAPCMGYIDEKSYLEDIRHVTLFFQRKESLVIEELSNKMEQYASQLEFEEAARLRDLIRLMQNVRQKQVISAGQTNADIIGIATEQDAVCIHCLNVREGQIVHSENTYPKHTRGESKQQIIEAFLTQRYFSASQLPQEIILPQVTMDTEPFVDALYRLQGASVKIKTKVKEERAGWQKMANRNAQSALMTRLTSKQVLADRAKSLQELLVLDELPKRIECFDISHTMGKQTVASCVVFNSQGPLKSDYRKFNIKGIQPGDDYAAMKQALTRRYTRVKNAEVPMPDILIIDGGKGQLNQALQVLSELDLPEFQVIGISKGPTRKAGWELLHLPGEEQPLDLDGDVPALHFIQHVRDEAHRFAITGHRARRNKKATQSVLEDIPGIGAKKRRDLLRYFGGIQAIQAANMDDLTQVPGINQNLAQSIYAHLHDE